MKTIRFDIITIFPGMFDSPFNESLIKKAREKGVLDIRVHNLRDFSTDKHRKVDDYPFGGGVGMVMGVEPIARAIEAIKEECPRARALLMTPAGALFNQEKAAQLAQEESLIVVCGRYEGVDERVAQHFVDDELSIGDYVLNGGEIPAMVLVETVARLVPGVVGDAKSLREESFAAHMLEYPQYTRPQEFRGYKAPAALLSGDHKKIREWQRDEAMNKTARLRPDLLDKLKNK